MTEIQNDIPKIEYKFAFREDDWFLDIVFNNPSVRYKLLIAKNYNYATINNIVFEIYQLTKAKRTMLEEKSQAFLSKKQYLLCNGNNDKIQITLDNEYALKELIDRYKIYELIGWVHLGKNEKIFKHCVSQKADILQKIYPIIDLSIRKVIGAKVIGPNEYEFEEAVNNAWINIIRYLTKIDTSKVMFSIFVKIAHLSAIRFKNITILPHKYNTILMSELLYPDRNSDEKITEDAFFDTVIHNNNDGIYNYDDYDDIDDFIDNSDYETKYYIESANKKLDEILDELENTRKVPTVAYQNVLSYSYNILSGKVKKLCFDKIFAEFFIDLINQNISKNIILKHTPILLDIMNSASNDPIIANDEDSNMAVFRLFKDWIKEKIKNKADMYVNNNKQAKRDEIEQYISRERKLYEYTKINKNNILEALITYKKNCNNFQI